MTRVRRTFVLLCGLAACVPAGAAAQGSRPAALVRTQFTTEHGLLASVVDHIVQTPDGFLWLATPGVELARFDGRRFHHFSNIQAFTAALAPDGALWLATRRGLLRVPSSYFDKSELPDTELYHPDPANRFDLVSLRVARNGIVWIGTAGGLFRYDGKESVRVGGRAPILAIDEALDGHIWILTAGGVLEVAGADVLTHGELPERLGVPANEIFHLLKDRRGNTWYSTSKGVARESAGKIEMVGTYGGERHGAFLSYEDRQGTVWIGKHEGLFRATAAGLDPVAPGMQVRSLHGDRDGNLWVGTNGDGLHRFRSPAVRMYAAADGLPDSPIMTVITARDGTLWAGANCGGLSRFDGTRFHTLDEDDGLLNSCVYAISEDRDGALWIGTWGGGAFRFHQGRFTPFTTKEGMPHDRVTSIIVARDGAVWFGTFRGLTRLKDGQLRTFTMADGLSRNNVFRVFEDNAGTIWAATRDGLDRLVGERFENYTAVPKSLIVPLGQDRHGGMFLRDPTKHGTLRLAGGRIASFSEFSFPMYMLETEGGELWFGGNGVVRVPPGQFERSREHDEPLDYEAFSTADGMATAELGASGQRTLALGSDNAVWAATLKGVARFDRAHLATTAPKPRVYLTEVTIGRSTFPAGAEVLVPAGTSHLRIGFSALELSSPEKIRMQYRLDGVDSEWLDAGRESFATYSTLRPGTHTLRIRTTDRRGVWDRAGVAFTLRQQPFFYQTRWFAAVMAGAGLLLVFGAYRWRVRQMAREMSARFDERLAERTRVARELHDTFLQTVQGSKMVADHALKNADDHARMVRAMEQLATWMDQATKEGRAALNSLRGSTAAKNDLAEAFRRAIDECRPRCGAELSFAVHGQARELHPVARDEVYRIGYEAVRNACMHSGAGLIALELRYAQDLVLLVKDNGVGMEPSLAERGKEGHFGVQGMRERAARIGARLTLVTGPGTGTEIALTVPGRIIFSKADPIENHR